MSVRPHCRCFQLPRQREPRPLRRPARAAAGGRARRGERGMAACVSQGDGDLASSRRRRRGSSDAVALTVDPDHRRAIVFRTAARRHRGRARHVARRPAAPRALRVALGRQAARPGRRALRRRVAALWLFWALRRRAVALGLGRVLWLLETHTPDTPCLFGVHVISQPAENQQQQHTSLSARAPGRARRSCSSPPCATPCPRATARSSSRWCGRARSTRRWDDRY